MAGILSGLFDFRSKEEKARSYEIYSKQIFPYGEEQRDHVLELLSDLFPNENKRYLIMHYILIKQGMIGEEQLDFKRAAAKSKKYRLIRITDEMLAAMQAVLNADFSIDERLEYPKVEELRAAASDILSSHGSL
jgi:hypothetical protein